MGPRRRDVDGARRRAFALTPRPRGGQTAEVRPIVPAARMGLLAGLAWWPSCFGAADFRCRDDDDCRWGERTGTCEATRYCSYPDDTCESGARYSDQAGTFANACVDPPPSSGTSTSTSTGTSSGAESTSSDTGGSTTASPQPVCGDAVPEGAEACDDGNAVDGDGCNTDCVASGSPRWDPPAGVHSGGDDLDAVFLDVDVRPDDTAIAVGREDALDADALLVLWNEQGEPVWAVQYDRGLGDDRASGVTAGVGSEIFVSGNSPNPDDQAGWIGVVEPANGDVETFAWTGQSNSVAIAYLYPSVLVVAGHSGPLLGARAFTEMLTPQWTAEEMISGAMDEVVAAPGRDVAFAAGRVDDHARLVELAPGAADPLVPLFDGEASTGVQGLALDDVGFAIGGYVGARMRDGWVQRVSRTGEPLWSWSSEGEGEDEVEDVAIAPSGEVIACGFTTALAQDARVWKLSPEGELRWTWTWAEAWPNDDVARAVAVRSDGDIIAVGGRTADDGATDAWIVRLAP